MLSKAAKFATVILALSLLGTSLLFIYIDLRVSKYLRSRGTGAVSAIYSDSFLVTTSLSLSLDQLLAQLRRRGYRSSKGEGLAPGQFTIKAGKLHIRTKEFMRANGRLQEPELVFYDPQSKEISNFTYPEKDFFVLEPEVLLRLGKEQNRARREVDLEQIPFALIAAIISIEDERFRNHSGIDLTGVARAIVANIKARAFVQGGSTITQQLAKNLFFSPRKTIGRKILEAMAAVSLEIRLSKNEILTLYANEVYLGQEGATAIHGVAEAADAFFGKPLSQLSLLEAAVIAGIIQAPSRYSPRRHLERAKKRAHLVLNKMQENRYISSEQLQEAIAIPLNIVEQKRYKKLAPHFLDSLHKELDKYLYLDAASLRGVAIHTGINLDMQICAEQVVSAGLQTLEKNFPALKRKENKLQAGLVAIEPHSGKVKAWAGGRNYAQSQFDHVNQSQRQIGSTIKPFLYLTALDSSLNQYRTATPVSLVSDRPLSVDLETQDIWQPENYDKEFRGDVTFRYAFERSLNIPAVYIGQRVGIKALLNTTTQFGLNHDWPQVPSLALGSGETNPLRLTNAYAALANEGVFVPARLFVRVLDSHGVQLVELKHSERRVATSEAVYVLTNMMQGVVERGTGRVVRRLGYQSSVAGKTGTSSEARDSWFAGFTPNLAVGIWVGFDDNSKIGLTGASAAGPIWTRFMQCIRPFHEELNFRKPNGVVLVEIDKYSGELATKNCPRQARVKEVFVRGTQPTSRCKKHLRYEEELPPDYREAERPSRGSTRRKKRKGLWEVLFGE